MKPPKVSRALLRDAMKQFPVVMDTRPINPVLPRHPLGLQPNALPRYYLVAPSEGGLRVMWDKSKDFNGATGPQVCLATISPETLALLLASKAPVELTP